MLQDILEHCFALIDCKRNYCKERKPGETVLLPIRLSPFYCVRSLIKAFSILSNCWTLECGGIKRITGLKKKTAHLTACAVQMDPGGGQDTRHQSLHTINKTTTTEKHLLVPGSHLKPSTLIAGRHLVIPEA